MRIVDVAEVGGVVIRLSIALVDVGLVDRHPSCLIEVSRQAVLVVVVHTPDLVHAQCRVGKGAVHNTLVGTVADAHAVGAKAVLIAAPDRCLVDVAEERNISLLVPVGQRSRVATLILEKLLVQSHVQSVPWEEGSVISRRAD